MVVVWQPRRGPFGWLGHRKGARNHWDPGGRSILGRVRRGILGGTFDPPHVAHLVVGEVAYRQLDLDVITFVPAGAPWQKADRFVTAPRHRWAMTQAAVKGVGYFEADDREVLHHGWSYTIDTLAAYAEDDVTLILGADAAARLPTWHRAEEVMARATIAVVDRPGTDRSSVETALAGQVVWLRSPMLDISGTELRRRAAQGESIRFMVRDAVWAYVETHSIYD